MKKILYLECAAGISGDMFVAAMVDLGVERTGLLAMLERLQLEHVSFHLEKICKNGFAGTDFEVEIHHHHEHEHDHHQEHEHHHHEHDHHHHDHHHAHHEHRNLADVLEVIHRAGLTARAADLAEKIFTIVAEAEAAVHGKRVDEVHFHEVGAVDSIADIAAAAYCADELGIDDVVVSSLSEGTGFVECAHGSLPVPVPAVLKIAERYGIVLRTTGENGEMTTPTGIAVAAALRTRTCLPEEYVVRKCGIGFGKKEFKRPNLLRAMILEEKEQSSAGDRIMLLETNLDDCTGEQLGYAGTKLLEAGARDVHTIPAYMKKNRPGWLLRVICDPEKAVEMEHIIFRETTAIGLRKQLIDRVCLERDTREVALAAGRVQVKCSRWSGGVICSPEYESVKALSDRTGVPFCDLYAEARKLAEREEGVK